MVAGVTNETGSLAGSVLSPVPSGLDIQTLGSVLKHSNSAKSFVEALSEVDPDKVRDIIVLLEQLASVSLSEKGALKTAVSNAEAVLESADESLHRATQAVVDEMNDVNNAEANLAQAKLSKKEAEAEAATAQYDRNIAQTAKDAADKVLEEQGPGYDDEHIIILKVIKMLKELIGNPDNNDCENSQFKALIDSKVDTVSGWNIDVHHGPWDQNGPNLGCSAGWFGWSGSELIGSISTELKGKGHAILKFAECHDHNGVVKVYLDGVLIASAGQGITKNVDFDFNNGSILEIKEFNGSIMELISFEVSDCKTN